MRAPTECLRCKGSLEPGFIVDNTQHHSTRTQRWFEGEPEKSFWTGLKTKGLRYHEVRTLRCTRCGYLESFTA